MMDRILHINTALEHASVCISENEQIIAAKKSTEQKEHAAFLQPAIREICAAAGIPLRELAAVAVVAGPGSYTGLRVGLAGAKGICYALDLPLITINTLEWMAEYYRGKDNALLCPVIDARRNEIFTGVFDPDGREVRAPYAHILSDESFSDLLNDHRIHFFGNGAEKCASFIHHPAAAFTFSNPADNQELVSLGLTRYRNRQFTGLAYAQPLYVKEFYSTIKK